MNNMTFTGLLITVIGITTFLFDRFSSLNLSNSFAKQWCGEQVMTEPNAQNAALGILTENACGFNADMYLALACVLSVLIGVALIAVGANKNSFSPKF